MKPVIAYNCTSSATVRVSVRQICFIKLYYHNRTHRIHNLLITTDVRIIILCSRYVYIILYYDNHTLLRRRTPSDKQLEERLCERHVAIRWYTE